MAISIITDRCPQDHKCPALGICPENALSQKGFNAPAVDEKKCTECGTCIDFCPHQVFQKK